MVPFISNNLLQELTSIDKMHIGSAIVVLFCFFFFFRGSTACKKKNQVAKKLEMVQFSVLIRVGSMAETTIS